MVWASWLIVTVFTVMIPVCLITPLGESVEYLTVVSNLALVFAGGAMLAGSRAEKRVAEKEAENEVDNHEDDLHNGA
jgi:hypothetical protein